jgi:hypothetical protein
LQARFVTPSLGDNVRRRKKCALASARDPGAREKNVLDSSAAMPHLMPTLLAREAPMSPIRPRVTVSVLIG